METQSKVLKWGLIIGIIIVLNLFFNYSLSLFYKMPEYSKFCPTSQVVTIPDNQQACVEKGGQWTNNVYYDKTSPRVPVGEIQPKGYCDLDYTCRTALEDATKAYNRNIFIVLVLFGVLSVLIGNFFKGNDVISYGFALGGLLSFVVASIRYWNDANDYVHVAILAVALLLLVWIAVKKFKS